VVGTRRIIASPWIVAPPAVIYLVTLLPVSTLVLPEVIAPVRHSALRAI